MRDISSIEIGAIVRELKPSVDGSRLRKFYDLGGGAFKFAFYNGGSTHLVYVKLLKTVNLTQYSETAEEATPFAMGIRKRLENSVVDSIEQKNNDRIIALNLDKGAYTLVLEMYGKGNVLLLNKEMVIELCYRKMSQSEREIKPGTRYEYPESAPIDVFSLTASNADALLEGLEISKNLMSALSGRIGVGPLYLEDIILRAGLDPKAKQFDKRMRAPLVEQLVLFSHRLSAERPRLYTNGAVAEDYALCDIKKYHGTEHREFSTFSELLDHVYVQERTALPNTERSERLRELNINIGKQLALAESISQDAERYTKYGHALFRKMHEVNAMCDYLRENKRVKLEELKERFPNLSINALDLKNKTVTIAIDEE